MAHETFFAGKNQNYKSNVYSAKLKGLCHKMDLDIQFL